jgi:hypothetical protein
VRFERVPSLCLGTTSWSAESWVGPFYPPGTPPADFFPIYATLFTVPYPTFVVISFFGR